MKQAYNAIALVFVIVVGAVAIVWNDLSAGANLFGGPIKIR